jgi:hypothetical protein
MCPEVETNRALIKTPEKYKFVLTRYIMERNEFTGAITYGLQRIGKTSYSVQVLYDIYHDWNEVFRYTLFQMEDVISLLEELVEEDKVLPCFIWDDAGVHAGKSLWFTNKNKVDQLKALFDVIGTATKGIIFTTPNAMDLLKILRSYEFLRIKIAKYNSDNYRVATGYQMITLPSGTQRVSKRFKDQYSVMLPDEFYKRYLPVRKDYLKQALLHIKRNAKDVDIDVDNYHELQYREERKYVRRPQFTKKETRQKLETAGELLDVV